MSSRATKAEREEAIAWFRKNCPKGSTVYTVLRHRSASGMLRRIGLVGITVRGCGMDMGFELVYSIAQAVYGDGYALKQRWI